MGATGGYLTTHVLDTARGCPAAGLRVEVVRIEGDRRIALRSLITNADGRTDAPAVPPGELTVGVYELVFHAGPYLDGWRERGAGPGFLDRVPVRFGVDDPERHFHVPLLLSPFGYSTYRGS